MISISPVTNAPGAWTYYTSGDYYIKGSEDTLSSEWQGKGANKLGLSGDVDKTNFNALLSGQVDGTQVTRKSAGINHRPGWDITLSAPKSFSIMALSPGGDKRLLDIHQQANKIAMSVLERMTITRQTTGGKTSRINTANIISTAFTHTTSRNLDPQLHTHNVTMNLTQRPDGKWRSVESRKWYDNALLVGKVYQTELARLVKTLGYDIDVNHEKGTFEIQGVPERVLKHFSTRRAEIEAVSEKMNMHSAEARHKVAVITRKNKQKISIHDLHDRWAQRLSALQFDPQKLIEASKDRRIEHAQSATDKSALNDVRLSLQVLAEKEAVFTKKDLIENTLKLGLGTYGHAEIEQAIHALIKGKKLVQSTLNNPLSTTDPTALNFTTPAALKKECYILKLMQQGQCTQKSIATKRKTSKHIKDSELATGHTFKQGQKDAIMLIAQTKDQVVGIQGFAGTGKTYMLKTAAQLIEHAGIKVRGLCPTNSAAKTLQDETRIPSQTLASFIYQMENADQKTRNHSNEKEVWIVDEASLINAKGMADLLTLMRKTKNRAVLVGDRAQLGAIEWGKPFRLMISHNMRHAQMKDIIRQKDERLLQAVKLASQAHTHKALDAIKHDIFQSPDSNKLKTQIVEDYLKLSAKKRAKTLVIIPDNETRNEVMKKIRDGLIEEGVVAGNQLKAQILINAGMNQVEKGDARFYKPNMIVEFGKNYKTLGVKRGDRFMVSSINKHYHTVELAHLKPNSLEQDKRQNTIIWNPSKVAGTAKYGVETYKAEPRDLGIGDTILWNKTLKDAQLKNGDQGKIIKIKSSIMTVEFANGQIKELDVNSMRNFNYAYALTTFIAQGQTYDKALVMAESWRRNLIHQKSFYVGISRARYQTKIYTDDTGKLKRALSERTGEKTSALENNSFEHKKDRLVEHEKPDQKQFVRSAASKLKSLLQKAQQKTHDLQHFLE